MQVRSHWLLTTAVLCSLSLELLPDNRVRAYLWPASAHLEPEFHLWELLLWLLVAHSTWQCIALSLRGGRCLCRRGCGCLRCCLRC